MVTVKSLARPADDSRVNNVGRRHRSFFLFVLFTLVAVGLPLVGGSSASASTRDPWISAVAPAVGPKSGGATVTITGRHFTGVTAVRFGGDPGARLDVTSDTSLTVQTPAHATGTYRVRLIAPGRSSARTLRSIYTFVTTPAITNVDPPLGPISGGTTVLITGHGFTDATAVRFDGVPGTNLDVLSNASLTVDTPAGTAGDVRVRVIKRGSSSERSDAAVFTYDATPTIAALSPSAGGTDHPTNVSITGTGFVDVQGVSFGSVAASSYDVVSSTEISATVDGQAAGAVDVTVQTAAGSTATSSASTFTFVGTPSVDYPYLMPNSGLDTGGTVAQIQGHNLTGVTAVKLGGANASFTVVSDSQITLTTPASATTGYVNLEVVGPNGTAMSYWAFTYGTAPVITGISPSSGSSSGWNTVELTGAGLYPLNGLTFGGEAIPYVVSASGDTLAVPAPPHPSGTVDLVITTPFGTYTFVNGYTYLP